MSPRRILNLPVAAFTRAIRQALRTAWRFIFKPAARYPADPRAVFILFLSVFSGVINIVAQAGPESLEAVLPRWAVVTWGVLLATGSAMTLVGMAFQSLTGILMEQYGSVMVGATTIFYSVIALWLVGQSAGQPIGIVLAWGISCFIRWVQLQALINQTVGKIRRLNDAL